MQQRNLLRNVVNRRGACGWPRSFAGKETQGRKRTMADNTFRHLCVRSSSFSGCISLDFFRCSSGNFGAYNPKKVASVGSGIIQTELEPAPSLSLVVNWQNS